MKRLWIIKASLALQIAMFVWACSIEFYYSRYRSGDPAIFGSLLPDMLFLLLGIVNAVAVVTYTIVVYQKKLSPDIGIIGLAAILAVIAIFYIPLSQWVVSG